MSVIRKSSRLLSSFHSLKNYINKAENYHNVLTGKKNASKLGLFNFGFGGFKNYSKEKKGEGFTLNNSHLTTINNQEKAKKSIDKNYPTKDYKSLVKYIKSLFINKYSNAYYKIQGNFLYDRNNKYFLYDYYKINDILKNKKCALVAHLNEFNYTFYQKELLIRFYKPKERYIIMKYLLNFIYKFDILCYNKSKEITDFETKEEIIKTFYYLTSEQYIYEHLFENDSFKGMQNLLKHVNLANKKASYDYSYLDMTKNTSLSQENEVIVNTLKYINEYINNRNFLERKLIKNYPIEKVPNIVPNYCPLGLEMNIFLNDYRIARKSVKISNHEETKDLINKYREEFIQQENKNQKSNLLNKKLFNIQENMEENESGKSDVTDENKNKVNKLNYKNILSESLNNISESSNKKESSNELKKGINSNDLQNKVTLFEFPDVFSINKRYDKDPETKDIEQLLEKVYNTPKKINTNFHMNNNNHKEGKQIKNQLIKDERNNKYPKVKFRMEHLKLKNEFKNNEKDINNNILKNLPLKNKLIKGHNERMIKTPIKKQIPSAMIKFRESSLILNRKKANNQHYKNNIINSPSFNNISSSINNENNYISPNLSSSFKIHKRKNSAINISNKKSSYIINNKLNKYINFSYNKDSKKGKNENEIIFKDTESFIKDSIIYKNKITIKPNIILKNFETFFNNNIPSNQSIYSEYGFPSSKKFISLSPNNSLKKMRGLFKKTDFEKLVFQMNKRLLISKKKESKSYTFRQILKNSEIYSTKLN